MAFRRWCLPASSVLLTLLPAIASCGIDDRDPASGGSTSNDAIEPAQLMLEEELTIKTWWSSGVQREGLLSAVGHFTEVHPTVSVYVDADRETALVERDDSPSTDLFLVGGGVFLEEALDAEHVASLSDLAASESWSAAFPLPVLEKVTWNGEIMALPFYIERENNLFVRASLFEEENLQPPKTLAEFFDVCGTFQAADKTPLAVPATGWALGIVAFEALMPGLFGGEFYRQFVSGQADLSGPELGILFAELDRILDCSNVASASVRWDEEADTFRRGDAAMYIMGDWALAYLEGDEDSRGYRVSPLDFSDDFFAVQPFGESGHYVFNTGTMALASDASSPNAGHEFLRILASEAGQTAFHMTAKSVPARLGVDVSSFPERVRKQAQDYIKASTEELLLPGYGTSLSQPFQFQVHEALLLFAVGGERACEINVSEISSLNCAEPARDVDALITRIRDAYAGLN